MGSEDPVPDFNISQALRTLPLCDEAYLGMQAMNLGAVDAFLEQQETRLLDEYLEEERTPFEATIFVSALSQMWVFALYELLRTWRQRVWAVLGWAREFRAASAPEREGRLAAKKREIEGRAAEPQEATAFHWPAYERAATDDTFVESLRKAFDRTERLFRRIGAFRVSLAKHEMPGIPGSYAMAPGYGRIDLTNGSIYWQVVLRGDEVDVVSRRTIADECRRLALDRDVLILPENIQQKLKKLQNHSYGVKRIAVVLDDGTSYAGVYVSWCKEVLSVEHHDTVPFGAAHVVEVRTDPFSERPES